MATSNLEDRLAYTTAELARMLPPTQHTWQRWVREGRVKAIKPFGRVLIPKSEVERILAGEPLPV